MSAGRNPELSEMAEGANEGRADVLLGREKVRDERRAVTLNHQESDDKVQEGRAVNVPETARQ